MKISVIQLETCLQQSLNHIQTFLKVDIPTDDISNIIHTQPQEKIRSTSLKLSDLKDTPKLPPSKIQSPIIKIKNMRHD